MDRDLAAALFNECYLGSLGLYNEEFLTEQRIAYFNYLKEMLFYYVDGSDKVSTICTNIPEIHA